MTTYPSDFETFWRLYPRKVSKVMAYKAWQKLEPDINQIIKALEWQTQQDQWTQGGGKYIPHPSTYLNQQRYEDEPPQEVKKVYPTWY